MNRATASGISLTETDAALVKGMLRRGDRQHDIAAWFGVNGGRIARLQLAIDTRTCLLSGTSCCRRQDLICPGQILHTRLSSGWNVSETF